MTGEENTRKWPGPERLPGPWWDAKTILYCRAQKSKVRSSATQDCTPLADRGSAAAQNCTPSADKSCAATQNSTPLKPPVVKPESMTLEGNMVNDRGAGRACTGAMAEGNKREHE